MDEFELLVLIEKEINIGSLSPNHKSKEEGLTPLHRAAAITRKEAHSKSVEIAKLLISHGADINARNKDNVPPLFYAMFTKNYALTELLLERGAEISSIEKKLAIDSADMKLIHLIGDYLPPDNTDKVTPKKQINEQIKINWGDVTKKHRGSFTPTQSSVNTKLKTKNHWWQFWK